MNNEAQPRTSAMPSGLPYGAHNHGDGQISFALWAPWKKSVHLIGDFNGWDPTADPLSVDSEGVWYTVKQLPPGRYAYQFVIDGETVIGDPYARQLQWDGGNQPHAVIEVGAAPYEWGDGGFQMRPFHQLVLYELHVGDFSPAGSFEGVIERLDYLAALGVNVIELMPIQEFPGDQGWGYNPAFFFAPETSYGSPTDLKHLIDAAHQRGIAVILDMVLSHTTGDSPISLLYPYDQNPYFGDAHNPWGFPSFNHWDDATKRLVRDIQGYWLNEYHIDGFRYDYAPGIGYDGINGLSFIAWSARESKPHVYLIAEYMMDDPTAVVHDTQVHASWHWQFRDVLKAQLCEADYRGQRYGDLDAVLRVLTFAGDGYADPSQPINYLECHDDERLVADVMTNPAIDVAGATRKSMLGAILLFTAQGVPMLYHGQEFGARSPKTTEANKLPWEYLHDAAGQALFNHYASLARLRHSQGALTSVTFEPLLVDVERKALAYHRWDDMGSVVVVAVNFSPTPQRVAVPFPRPGRWHEWLHDYDERVGVDPWEVEVPDSFGKIWVFVAEG